jgi:hypothetical protein
LSKLSTVQPSRDSGYEESSPLTPFLPFLAINSVSEVSLRSYIFKDDDGIVARSEESIAV